MSCPGAHLTPWRVRVNTWNVFIIDATGEAVSVNGRTEQSVANAHRVCELANITSLASSPTAVALELSCPTS